MTSEITGLEAAPVAAPRTDGETLVEVEGVSKKFARSLRKTLFYAVRDLGSELTGRSVRPVLRPDEFWALQGLSFTLRRGEALGIIGPNGAGKSTLLKIITGIIKPTTGFVRTRGRVQALIELSSGMNPTLTGRENIYIRATLLGMPKSVIEERFDEIVRFAELEDSIDMPVQNYSSGMRVKLGFSIAINVDPDVLVLDEVLAVGDERFRAKAREAMSALLRRDVALIFISHNLNQVLSITDRALWLDRGQMKEIGSSRDVCSRYLAHQQEVTVDQINDRPIPMTRSIGAVSLEEVSTRMDGELLPRPFTVRSSQDSRVIELSLKLKSLKKTDGRKFYFTLFTGQNETNLHCYAMIQDEIDLSVVQEFSRTFRIDLGTLNPGHYQLGLLLQPEDDVSAILYGTYSLIRFTIAPREVLAHWRPGALHHARMIGNTLGPALLPVQFSNGLALEERHSRSPAMNDRQTRGANI